MKPSSIAASLSRLTGVLVLFALMSSAQADVLKIVSNDQSFSEKIGTAQFNVWLEGDWTAGSTVAITTETFYVAAGKAKPLTGGSSPDWDYRAAVATLTWTDADYKTIKSLPVEINDDTIAEGSEYCEVRLYNVTGPAVIDKDSLKLTIIDDDKPKISIAGGSIREPVTPMKVLLQLDGISDNAITVKYYTADGAAGYEGQDAWSGYDYTGVAMGTPGEVTWDPGTTGDAAKKYVDIPIINDQVSEGDEYFTFIVLDTGPFAVIGDSGATAIIRIIDDEPFPSISIADTSVNEDRTATITVAMTVETVKTVSVDYDLPNASNGIYDVQTAIYDKLAPKPTATEDQDYTATSGTLTWRRRIEIKGQPTQPGETGGKTFQVSIIDDLRAEGDEYFVVRLQNPVNAGLVDPTYLERAEALREVIQEWTATTGSTTDDEARAVALTSGSDVVTAGTFRGTVDFDPGATADERVSHGGADAYVTLLKADGTYGWALTFGGAGDEAVSAVAVADYSTEVYVAGTFQGTVDFDPTDLGVNSLSAVGGTDVFVSMFDSLGNYQWTKTFGGTQDDTVAALALDGSDNLYLTGTFRGTVDFNPGAGVNQKTAAGGDDGYVVSLSWSGTYRWATAIGGAGTDAARSVAVHPWSSKVLVGGVFQNTVNFGTTTGNLTAAGGDDAYVARLTSGTGVIDWGRVFSGGGNERVVAARYDDYGDILAAGEFSGTVDFDPGITQDRRTSAGGQDVFLVKLTGEGAYTWTKIIGSAADETAAGLAIQDYASPIVTGTFPGTVDFDPGTTTVERTAAGGQDVFGLKLLSDGTFKWVSVFGGVATEYVYGTAADDSSVMVAGSFTGTADFAPGYKTDNRISAGGADGFVTRLKLEDIVYPPKAIYGKCTILDNDALPRLAIVRPESGMIVNEADQFFPVTVTMTGSNDVTVTVSLEAIGATTAGTAVDGEDFVAFSRTLTWYPLVTGAPSVGDTTVRILTDDIYKEDRDLTLRLVDPVNAIIANPNDTLTIRDSLSLSIADAQTIEGDLNLQVNVTLTGDCRDPVSVLVTAVNGTATKTQDFDDPTPSPTTLTWAAHHNGLLGVLIPIKDDNIDEEDEYFTVKLQGATNANIARAEAKVTIFDNDPAPVLSISNTSVSERAGYKDVTVAIAGASVRNVTVDYETYDVTGTATATAGVDYLPASGTLTWAPGDTLPKSFRVTIRDDTISDPDEAIGLRVKNPHNATIGLDTAVLRITDDEPLPTLNISDVSASESSGTGQLLVRMTGQSSLEVKVDYQTQNGTAKAGQDYLADEGELIWGPNDTTDQPITITIIPDDLDEPNETMQVVLSTPVNALIENGTGTLTIEDDDVAPALSISDAGPVVENTGEVTVTVTLSKASGYDVSVDVDTAGGTAIPSVNYVVLHQTVTWSAALGESGAKTVTLVLVDENIYEGTKTVELKLSNAQNATISRSTGTVTVSDDESLPTLAVADASVDENDPAGVAAVVVTKTGASAFPCSVNYATADGTATAGLDYTATAGTLTWPATKAGGGGAPGGGGTENERSFLVTILNDALAEPTEDFSVTLSGASGATISRATGVVSIVDDDTQVVPIFTVANPLTAGEDNGNATIAVTVNGRVDRAVTINYTFTDVTATAGVDYTGTPGSLTWAQGGRDSRQLTIPVLPDDVYEGDETFTVNLAIVTAGATFSGGGAAATVTVTITDADPLPTLALSPVSVNEGVAATVNCTLTLRTASAVNVVWATNGGTATAGSDYTIAGGVLHWDALSNATQQMVINTTDDLMYEADETITVSLLGDGNVTLPTTNPALAVTILNNDPVPTVAISDVTVSEGTGVATVAVTMVGSSDQAMQVTAATVSGGTAVAGDDYTVTSKVCQWAAGETGVRNLAIPVTNDSVYEPAETIAAALSGETNVTVTQRTATVTVTDNDTAPVITVGDVSVGEADTTIQVPLTLTGATQFLPVTVHAATADLSAQAGTDYVAADATVTWTTNPGSTPAVQNLAVVIKDDSVKEPDETFWVKLDTAVNATIGDTEGLVTITDNDVVSLSMMADTTVKENAGSVTVTVTLTGASATDITAHLSTVDGTATAGSDLVGVTDYTVTWFDGETGAKTVTVRLFDDNVGERDEEFAVQLTAVDNDAAPVTDADTIVTITDDDVRLVDYSVLLTRTVYGAANAVTLKTNAQWIFEVVDGKLELAAVVEYWTEDGQTEHVVYTADQLAEITVTTVTGTTPWHLAISRLGTDATVSRWVATGAAASQTVETGFGVNAPSQLSGDVVWYEADSQTAGPGTIAFRLDKTRSQAANKANWTPAQELADFLKKKNLD